MKNRIVLLLKELDKNKIDYSLINISKKDINKAKRIILPKGVNEVGYLKDNSYPGGLLERIDIILPKKDIKKTVKILKKNSFKFGYGNDNFLSYFYYDSYLGLVNITLSYDKKFLLKENRKRKILTNKLFSFISPEGGGKTVLVSAVNTILKKYPIKLDNIHFGSFKRSRIHRIIDLIKKIFRIRKNKFYGTATLTDRYIYLTFNKIPTLRNLVRFIAPKPSIIFIVKADYNTHKKRRGPLCPPRERIEEIYSTYGKLKNKYVIDSSKTVKENVNIIANKILENLENQNEEAKYLRKIIQ